jgi:hypothetical protein
VDGALGASVAECHADGIDRGVFPLRDQAIAGLLDLCPIQACTRHGCSIGK